MDYKRGPKRTWDNDDVQVCAQGLCLEEMLLTAVPAGAVYYAKTRRRRIVPLTPELRQLTLSTIAAVLALLQAEKVPAAELRPQCEGCSMHQTCLPEITSSAASLDRRARQLFVREITD